MSFVLSEISFVFSKTKGDVLCVISEGQEEVVIKFHVIVVLMLLLFRHFLCELKQMTLMRS